MFDFIFMCLARIVAVTILVCVILAFIWGTVGLVIPNSCVFSSANCRLMWVENCMKDQEFTRDQCVQLAIER